MIGTPEQSSGSEAAAINSTMDTTCIACVSILLYLDCVEWLKNAKKKNKLCH